MYVISKTIPAEGLPGESGFDLPAGSELLAVTTQGMATTCYFRVSESTLPAVAVVLAVREGEPAQGRYVGTIWTWMPHAAKFEQLFFFQLK